MSRIHKRVFVFVFAAILITVFSGAHAGSYTDFFRAVSVDDVDAVKALLAEGCDPNSVDAKGNSALTIALRDGSLKVAHLLLTTPGVRPDT
jgi:ankyrin repeat protein